MTFTPAVTISSRHLPYFCLFELFAISFPFNSLSYILSCLGQRPNDQRPRGGISIAHPIQIHFSLATSFKSAKFLDNNHIVNPYYLDIHILPVPFSSPLPPTLSAENSLDNA
jgi:hypothetical protein